jgi:hypothetical protein
LKVNQNARARSLTRVLAHVQQRTGSPRSRAPTCAIMLEKLIKYYFLGGLYVKVTLFESRKVVKAKKTRPLQLTEIETQFSESFSILFPKSHIDQVTNIILVPN